MVCHELGLPLISAKVINKGTNTAGEGFYPFFKLYGINTSGKTEKELWSEEMKKIRECADWYKLQDYLGLDLGFTNPNIAELQEDAALIEDVAMLSPTYMVDSKSTPRHTKPEAVIVDGHRVFPRNRQTAFAALTRANHRCEIDPSHSSFIRKTSSSIPYMEPHHLIPMSMQDTFNVSLDIEENIVSLCPNCHKQIHYGQGAEGMLHDLFLKRRSKLKDAGIVIQEEELIEIYK